MSNDERVQYKIAVAIFANGVCYRVWFSVISPKRPRTKLADELFHAEYKMKSNWLESIWELDFASCFIVSELAIIKQTMKIIEIKLKSMGI